MPLNLSPTQIAFNARSDGMFRQRFQEQIDYLAKKIDLPTQHYDDLIGSAHDKSFVVAGAIKADLLNDFHEAMNRMVDEGKSVKWFKENFESIVQKRGWEGWTGSDTMAGRDWRARIIYQTNIQTSYNAGRYKQLTDPDLLKVRPYWKYVHDDRVGDPRILHKAWGDKPVVLPHDDPWWDTHFTPNGFGCRCRIAAVGKREYNGEPAPNDGTWEKTDRWGNVHTIPKGVDYGWDYTPGKSGIMKEMKPFVGDVVASLPKPLGSDLKDALKEEAIRQKAVKKAAKDAKEYVLTNGKETGVEFMYAYDENGAKVLTKSGKKARIDLTNEEIDLLKKTNGVVFVHNHPSGSSLSFNDFNMTLEINGGIVAHGHNGVSYYGKVIDTGYFNFNNKFNLIDPYVTKQLWETIDFEGDNNLEAARETANFFHGHIVNETLASIGTVEYSTDKMIEIPEYIKKIIDNSKEYFKFYKK